MINWTIRQLSRMAIAVITLSVLLQFILTFISVLLIIVRRRRRRRRRRRAVRAHEQYR